MKQIFVLVAGAVVLFALADAFAQSKKELTYTKDVAPIIKSYCIPCHLEENENPSGLALDDYEKAMKGGNHGSTVVPRKPQESYLYLKILSNPPFGKQMARNKKKLTEEETKTIYDWIAQGAKK